MFLGHLICLCFQLLYVLAQTPSQISGPLQKDVRVVGTILYTETFFGEKMCAERCFRDTSCGAFNHYRVPELKCELVFKGNLSTEPHDGVKSGIIENWTGFKGGCVHNPCTEKHQTCYNKDKVKRYCVFEDNGTSGIPVSARRPLNAPSIKHSTMLDYVSRKCFKNLNMFYREQCLWLPEVNKRFLSLDTSLGLDRNIGAEVRYKCDKGFRIKGTATVTCLESRKFSEPDPSLTCYRFLDDYFLAARFTPGIGVSTYSTWMDNTIDSDADSTIQDGCYSIDKDAKCSKHYVSGVVNKWQSYNIQAVKMSMFKNGAEVAYVTFSGVGSTKTDWFAKSRILGSTWTDVTTNIAANVLSIYGMTTILFTSVVDVVNDVRRLFHELAAITTKPVIRRFYLSNYLKACYDDLGWICVIEGPGVCTYDSRRPYPFFFYSTKTKKALLQTEFDIADNMVILLKIDNFP